MIDILFVHPNASKIIYQDLSKSAAAIEPPIWAAMLASHVESIIDLPKFLIAKPRDLIMKKVQKKY